ncbi:hypothetical protein CEXT_598421 [Caerostris extrusa]|uniref:Uncharacterized protein n=1 Tax=Caerostris extrusa TaxID=172846 RepID=A0AAV4R9F2_CAEEX|nr:hypothetical protein CEXT_598421 [Caerostris extrusa]
MKTKFLAHLPWGGKDHVTDTSSTTLSQGSPEIRAGSIRDSGRTVAEQEKKRNNYSCRWNKKTKKDSIPSAKSFLSLRTKNRDDDVLLLRDSYRAGSFRDSGRTGTEQEKGEITIPASGMKTLKDSIRLAKSFLCIETKNRDDDVLLLHLRNSYSYGYNG